MSFLARPLPAALTAAALAAASCAFATAAHADQFVEAADGAAIDCVLARGALTWHDMDRSEVHVVGRVIWFGRAL